MEPRKALGPILLGMNLAVTGVGILWFILLCCPSLWRFSDFHFDKSHGRIFIPLLTCMLLVQVRWLFLQYGRLLRD